MSTIENNVINMPIRRRQLCASCRIPFTATSPKHLFCPKCFRLGRAGAYLAAAHALFKGVPK